MAVLLLTACEAPKELGVVPYPQYAQTTSKTVELPSTVTFSTNLAKSDMNDLLAYLPDFAIPMKLVDKNPFVTIEITDATDNPTPADKIFNGTASSLIVFFFANITSIIFRLVRIPSPVVTYLEKMI